MKKWKESLMPLLNLLPALAVIALIAVTLPMTRPVLEAVPDRLTVSEETEDEKDTGEEDAAEAVELNADFPVYEDGIYVGSAQGYGGTITVQVTVEGGKITAIEILDASGETASFLSRAMAVIDSVLASQTWEVDVVSGATYSSNGILGAIQNALTGETVETETAAEQVTAAKPLSSDSFTDAAAYADGVYTGSAQGFGGQITVQVTISGGVMTAIKIVSAPGETASYLAKAKSVISAMLKSGSPNVDVVSGATYSSTGIINAVKRALNKAAINGTETEEVTETEASTEATGSTKKTTARTTEKSSLSSGTYVDGVYTGTGTGFGGDITVRVTVKNGKITKIKILSAEDETPSYLKKAKGIISSILAAQSTEVDVISGATYSSEGILEAVRNALKKALADDAGDSSEEDETDSGSKKKNTQKDSEETQSEDSDDGEDTSGYVDGVYSVQVQCTDEDIFFYWLQIDVTIRDGQITGVEVTKYDDTSDDPDSNETYLSYAINGRTYRSVWYEGVVSQVLTLQSGDGVDVVSRATYSSNAIIAGVQEALKQASATDSSDQTDEDESESSEESSSAQEKEETQAKADESESAESSGSEEENENTGYADGTYSAQTLCTDEDLFSYWLQISLTVQNGLITNVDVTKYNDTSDDPDSNETYLNYAINGRTYRNVWYEGVVSQVLTLQSGDGVDVVSRATYSSNAIITGVQNTLKQALAAGSSGQTEENETESSEESSSAQEEEETQNIEEESESSENGSADQEEGSQTGEEESESSEDGSAGQEEGNSQEEEGSNESSESSGSEEGDEDTGYTDGVYSAQTLCTDDDIFSYWLQIDLTVQNGLITGVDVTKYDDTSDDPDSNETYLNYAINGRTYKSVWYEGVVSQVLTLQSGDGVDVVSRATYSSNAIIAGVQNALSQASAESEE